MEIKVISIFFVWFRKMLYFCTAKFQKAMEEKNINLQSEARQYVHSMGRWYKFFAIVAIVGAAIMLLAALLIFVSGSLLDETMADYHFPAWVVGIIYVLCAGFELPMIIYLMKGSKAAQKGAGMNNNEAAVQFLRYSKKYWKFYGILSIVLLGLCVLSIPTAIILGLTAAL